ncbi:MAG: Ig-like domain-containing protein [Chloroflexi bacterium]|nr:Ig-like domain-containing protein [Chloroflexota bacterium]
MLLSRHRAITRVSLAALSFTIVIAFSQQDPIQAAPEQVSLLPESLLPQNVGIAVATDDTVTLAFDAAMDPVSVESALQVLPEQKVELSWNEDHTALTVAPERLWRADERYLVVVADSSATAAGDVLRSARRFSFTTETAPAVTDFRVRLASADLPASADIPANADLLATDVVVSDSPSVRSLDAGTQPAEDAASLPPTRTIDEVSATSSISISFTDEMDTADVEAHFAISPEVAGDLTWTGGDLVFTPTERLEPAVRYTISLVGSHDGAGNALGGKGNFSFIVQRGAQLITTAPKLGASDVEPATVEMWFSSPMDVDATNEAFSLTDSSSGALVGGRLNWNEERTQLIFSPDQAFAGGRAFDVVLAAGARDADGNPVETSWTFTSKASLGGGARSTTSTRTAPMLGAPAPSDSLVGYALNQINAARAAYGFAPLWLDAGMTAAATAHAWDQVSYGYYSHTSRNGASLYGRLAAAGVAFSMASENQCHYYGMSVTDTLNWCHGAFMSEPYPGLWNHIANVLNPRWNRVGVGIGDNGSHVVITWDFAP